MELKNKIYHQLLERGSNEILLVIVRSIIIIIIFSIYFFLNLLIYLSSSYFSFYCKKVGGGGGGAKAPPSPSLCAGPVCIFMHRPAYDFLFNFFSKKTPILVN